MNLPQVFDTFRLEKRPGEHKAFHTPENTTYPLQGVTYPTNYGDIAGYTGEDGYPLDVFIGTGDLLGCFTVFRPELLNQIEHKFCVNLTDDEEKAIIAAFEPVVRQQKRFESIDELLLAMEPFKDAD